MSASTLFDTLRQRYSLKSDAALCEKLDVEPPRISKARRFNSISSDMIVRICDAFDLRPRDVRQMAGQ